MELADIGTSGRLHGDRAQNLQVLRGCTTCTSGYPQTHHAWWHFSIRVNSGICRTSCMFFLYDNPNICRLARQGRVQIECSCTEVNSWWHCWQSQKQALQSRIKLMTVWQAILKTYTVVQNQVSDTVADNSENECSNPELNSQQCYWQYQKRTLKPRIKFRVL